MVYALSLTLLGDRTKRSTSSRKCSCRLPHALELRGHSAAADLDLPHRRQPGEEPDRGGAAAIAAIRFARRPLPEIRRIESKQDILPDRQLASKETAAKIWQALARLPFDQRTALILREVDGLRYEEIAYTLDVAVGTVKSRLTRARQALRADLLGLRL